MMQILITFRHTVLAFACLCIFSCQKSETEPSPPVDNDPQQYDTPFAEVPATPDVVMYEINQRAFSASGNLAGILPRLDSIKALGVNVIWLMPIHPIGAIRTVNSPYCVRNYYEVNPEYGNLEALRTLVKQAHARKMAVILDWVANHTSWDNPWIQNASWYTQDGNGNIIHPAGTNWQDVADLNFDNSEMRLEMIKAMKYWVLQANIDGFRCDAADFVPFAFWKQAIDSLRKIPNRNIIMLAEGARVDHFTAGFQMNFGWDFFTKNKSVFRTSQSAIGYFQTHQSEYAGVPAGSHRLRFTSNHDECAWDDTPLGLFGGKDGSMAAFVVTAFMGGAPLIYNGQEVGCPVKLPFFSRFPIDWTTNPDMFQAYKRLMELRAANPAARRGTLEQFSSTDVAAFRRQSGSNEVLVMANVRNATQRLSIPASLQNTLWTNGMNGESVTLGSTQNLAAYEYKVYYR